MKKRKGEITMQAATSDPNHKRLDREFTVQTAVHEVDEITQLTSGFRQSMLSGKANDGTEVELWTGAGLGSKWIGGTYKKGDLRKHWRIDGEKLLYKVLDGLLNEPQPAIAPGDHVEFVFTNEDGPMKGIVLRVFQNGDHGEWCDIWSNEETHDNRGSHYSVPLKDEEFNREVKRIPGPRGQ